MKWQPGKSPLQQLMQNARSQAQAQWQRNQAGGWWLQQQKEKLLQQQKAKTKLQLKPSAAIGKTWPEFNTEHNNQKGMHIHVTFTVANLLRRMGTVAAYFYSANGVPLKDFNHNYGTKTGNVCVAHSFTPMYPKTLYNDFVLFMPYFELHRGSGNHSLKFFVDIWDDNSRELARSEWVSFTYTSS